jgi:S-formylglutathione hydrolase
MSQSTFITESVAARSTGVDVDYAVLVPTHTPPGQSLPLILHLHGAMSSAASLHDAKEAYDSAWASGALPPALVACASTPTMGGFYVDHAGGPAWGTFVGEEFPEHLGRCFDLSGMRVVIGFSMGGYGALKIVFGAPDRYAAVAALCPTIFPAETASAVPEVNRPAILNDLNRAMGEDERTYSRNSVYGRLRANRSIIQRSGMRIYFDCGTADEFSLHDGAAYLHEVLEQFDIPHDFRSVAGAGHADEQMPVRRAEAIRVLGDALQAARNN